MKFPKAEKWVILDGHFGWSFWLIILVKTVIFRPYKTNTIKSKSEYAKTVTDFTRDSIIGFKISARIRAERIKFSPNSKRDELCTTFTSVLNDFPTYLPTNKKINSFKCPSKSPFNKKVMVPYGEISIFGCSESLIDLRIGFINSYSVGSRTRWDVGRSKARLNVLLCS